MNPGEALGPRLPVCVCERERSACGLISGGLQVAAASLQRQVELQEVGPQKRIVLLQYQLPGLITPLPAPSPVQQSSFYGYMGMLPKRYTQGVMTGESKYTRLVFFSFYSSLTSLGCILWSLLSGTAGVIISLSRIFTKLLIKDEKKNTLIFFLVSISMEMLCFLLHLLVRRSRFVRYYTSHAQGKGPGKCHDPRDNGTGYRVHHDVTAEEVRFVSLCFFSPLCIIYRAVLQLVLKLLLLKYEPKCEVWILASPLIKEH